MIAPATPLPESPWGALLTVYFVLIAAPSGLTMVASWRRLRRPAAADGARARASSWTALGLLAVAGLLLLADLGRPERFFLMVTRFDNLGSPISLGAKALLLKGLLLAVDLYLLHRLRAAGGVVGDRRTRATITAVTVSLGLTSVFLAVYPVAVLGRTWMAPVAGTGGALLVFALTALLIGVALQMVLDLVLTDPPPAATVGATRSATLAALGVAVVLGPLVAGSVLTDPATAGPVRDQLADGLGAVLWWGGSVAAGTVLPAVGLLATRRRSPRFSRHRRLAQWVILTGLLLGACTTRYLVVVVGPLELM